MGARVTPEFSYEVLTMNRKTKWLIFWLLTANIGMAQAQTFSVAGEFKEYLTNGVNTYFDGTFDWDGVSVTNLQGKMNSSMYPVNNVDPDYVGSFPLMNLTFQLGGTQISGNTVTASVFLKNTTDVYRGGGFDGVSSEFVMYGGGVGSLLPVIPGETPNENAFFTLVFDKATMAGVVDKMVYGDCTAGGLMSAWCMAGEITGTSPMFAGPLSLSITPVTVPVPSVAWLFVGAVAGLLGGRRLVAR